MKVFHIAERRPWEKALKSGIYERSTKGRTLEEVGFIHCSFGSQVVGIANLLYRGQTGLVLLEIDTELTDCEVRVENLDGGDELFPHIYGPLPTEAVLKAHPFGTDGEGQFVLPSTIG